MRPMMRWEDLYDELYDADDGAEIELLKTQLLCDLKAPVWRRPVKAVV